jgi:hypothetical protein
MTREDQLRAARRFLALPHPAAADDDVSKALRYIELRNQAFRATKQRRSKRGKRAAGSLLQAMVRARKAGLPTPAEEFFLWYHDIATTPSGIPKRADGFKQRLALQQAFWLLNDRSRPCIAGSKGEWCKLAAILLGYPKPTAGLLSQARQLRVQFKLEKMKIPGQN